MYDNSKPRQCLWINPAQDPAEHGGYVPSVVIEGTAGHMPLLGSGPCSSPWVWGPSLEAAQAECAKYNEEVYGFSVVDASRIVFSSIHASHITFLQS